MKLLLSAALAVSFVLPAAAQTQDVTLAVHGEIAVLLSKNPAVTQQIAFRGYLLGPSDLAFANQFYDSDGYTLLPEGLEIDGSIHGPDAFIPWKNAAGEVAFILDHAKKNGKRKGSEELADRVADLKRALKALSVEKKSEQMAASLGGCEREPGRLSNFDVKAAEAKLAALEVQACAAKSEQQLAAASRDLDLFKASLPK